MSFTIDGLTWPGECRIQRIAELTASEVSGLLLDKSYFNDCLGTWLRYEVTVFLPFGQEDQYSAVYEALTDPVDGHSFVFPYNQGTVQVTGRVTQVSDLYRPGPGGTKYWEGTTFTVLSNAPTKTYTLGQMISRGRAALPDVASGTIGETYVFTASGWEKVTYGDGDNTYY